MSIAGVTIEDGNSTYAGGVNNDGTLTISNSTLVGNSAESGGGGIDNGGTLTVTNSILSDNDDGGITNGGTLWLSNSTLSANSAGFGGGIYNFGSLNVADSTLTGNSAEYSGGGIFCQAGSSKVVDSTLVGNSAVTGLASYYGEGGGGICIYSGTLTVSNSTLSGNSAGYGAGIYNTSGGSATLNNTIVANSVSGNDIDVGPASGSIFSGGYDLIGDGSELGDLTNSLQGNPLLAPLGNYGGPTQTMALLPGSPAIDAGSDARAVDGNGGPLTTDQRGVGFPRVVDSTVDIGAFESQGFTITATTGSEQSATAGTNFAEPLTVKVTAENAKEPVNGGLVTFATSESGSPTLSANTAALNDGSASVTAIANGGVGTYTVTAFVTGASAPASFSLTTNIPSPSNFVVIDTGDYSQRSAGDNPIDTNGGVSLRSAIAAANADAGFGVSDTITFSAALNGDTLTLTLGQLEFEAGSGSIAIAGDGQIAVSGNNQGGVFLVDSGATVNIAGLTIEDGKSTFGGGINNDGTLSLMACTIEDNSTNAPDSGEFGKGGGVYNTGLLTVNSSTLEDNSASEGGGIYNGGTLTLNDTRLTDNSATNGSGGGIWNGSSSSTSVVSGCTLSGNSASDGGGIENDGTLIVIDSTLADNSAEFGGGGINNRGGTLTVSNSTLADNSAGTAIDSVEHEGGGGGIYNQAMLKVSDSTLADNSSEYADGGGVDNAGVAILNNSIVAESTSGGDLYGSAFPAPLISSATAPISAISRSRLKAIRCWCRWGIMAARAKRWPCCLAALPSAPAVTPLLSMATATH